MEIHSAHDNYYVYTALYHMGKQSSCGACPLYWEEDLSIKDRHWKKGLNWADGNYHLYDSYGLDDEHAEFVEDIICTALNERETTFGKVMVKDSGYEVRWCLLEEEQMRVIMDVTQCAE